MPEIKEYDFRSGEILLFDKELDWTSFDLVQKIRNRLCRHLKIKKLKVGHAGTLDPKATGLMILCTGKATKKIETLQAGTKEYVATLKFGATTPSFDVETEESETFDTKHLTHSLILQTLEDFKGEQNQIPPMFSAVKINGKRAYEHARNGEIVELKSRMILIYELELIDFNHPYATIRVQCSKGTYIRSLARDIGEKLGCGAYLTELRRTKIGEFSVEQAMTTEYFLENLNNFVTNSEM